MNPLNPLVSGISQHATHRALTGQTKRPNASRADLDLDAIIVPASRPAAHLDHAITLARRADCWLLVLCSKQLHSVEVEEFIAARSHHKAIVVDLPSGYSHPLLEFPGLFTIKDDLPEACGYHVTDLSMKRNIGLVLARMSQWRRVFFLDDDIRDITYPDLRSTVNMLGSFSAAGLWVTEFPDNSIACHANRLTDGFQDVFVSGAALAVDCAADIGFFPDIYNEDWLFFFDDASRGRLANSYLKATQLRYSPFADPRRAAWQEFGDVLAEGLYALLHLRLEVRDATRDYWAYFLEARRRFLEGIITRSQGDVGARDDMLIEAVQQSLKCSLTISPDVCERYIRLWRQDLADWKRRVAGVPVMSSVDQALREMGLTPSAASEPASIPPRRPQEAPNVRAGAVAIPRPETMKELPEDVRARCLGSVITEEVTRDTIPFPAVTEPIRPESPGPDYRNVQRLADEVGGRQCRQRLGIRVPWLTSPRPWHRDRVPSIPLPEPEAREPNGSAAPEPQTAAHLGRPVWPSGHRILK